MYLDIINFLAYPLAALFVFVTPVLGFWVSFIVAKSFFNKSYLRNLFVARITAPIGGVISSTYVLLSGIFATDVLYKHCRITGEIDCSGSWLLLPYAIFFIPIGLITMIVIEWRLGGKTVQNTQEAIPIKRYEKILSWGLPIIFILTFVLFFPADEVGRKIYVTKVHEEGKAEKMSAAKDGEFVCYVTEGSELSYNSYIHLIAIEPPDVFYTTVFKGVDTDKPRQETPIGKINGNTIILENDWTASKLDNCYNSTGESFSEKFVFE